MGSDVAVIAEPAKAVRKKQAYTPVKSRLSAKTRQAIELWTSGAFPTVKALALHCNISDTWLSNVLNREDVIALILARTRQRIAQHAPVASARLMQLMVQDENRGVAKDSAQYLMGTSGIAPPRGPGIVVNNNVAIGYDIELESEKTIEG